TSVRQLGGLATTAPVVAILFFIPAMNLGGIPPFSGFIGKVGLLQAGVADGGILAWMLVAGGTLTSLLTLWAVSKVWTKAFWQAPVSGDEATTNNSGASEEDEDDLVLISAPPSPRKNRQGKRLRQPLPKSMVIPTAAL